MGFRNWKSSRPFWGALLTVLSGLLILWVPFNLYLSTFLPGSIALIGLIFGGLITIIGVMAFIFPPFSKVFGIMTIFLAILSVIGALGGFLFGTILGIIGGSLLIAWRLVPLEDRGDKKSEPVDHIDGSVNVDNVSIHPELKNGSAHVV